MARTLTASAALTILALLAGFAVSASGPAPTKTSGTGAEALVEPPPEGMVLLRGGTYRMGRASAAQDEAPVHAVTLAPFYLDKFEVTNRRFAEFIDATGHRTTAEKSGYAWGYVEGDTEFRKIAGASWLRPRGPGSSHEKLPDHPVVNVSWHDADAFARWAGKRLPTEAEWEYAARSGGKGHVVAGAGGADRTGIAANFWEGTWPERNTREDGFLYTAPAGRYPANEAGVYDMIGNVWEWCSDWYAPDYYGRSPSEDPTGPAAGEKRVARGGSWFCSTNYCGAYSSDFRGASPVSRGFNNVGFRCAADAVPVAEEEGE